jgi:hypothetical protein
MYSLRVQPPLSLHPTEKFWAHSCICCWFLEAVNLSSIPLVGKTDMQYGWTHHSTFDTWCGIRFVHLSQKSMGWGALAYPEGGFGGVQTPPEIIPKFWQSRAEFPVPWKIDLKNLIGIRFHPFANWVEPLTRGLLPPDPCSLCPLSSTEFVELPQKKISGYATGEGCVEWRNLNYVQIKV